MFENSGEKLKSIAKFIFILLSVIECVAGIIIAVNAESTTTTVISICSIAVLLAVNYAIALVLYCFGTIVDNVADIAEKLCDEDSDEPLIEEDDEPSTLIDENGDMLCPRCCEGKLDKKGVCTKCGYSE